MKPSTLFSFVGGLLRPRVVPAMEPDLEHTTHPDRDPSARVLCVDDNVELLRGLHRQLHRDHDVVLATGAAEALAALKNDGPFDVIICDLRMPGVEGVTFLNQLRDLSPDSERIILTGWADPVTVAIAATNGRAMRLLAKPCPTPVLREAVSDALIRNRARRLRAAVTPVGSAAVTHQTKTSFIPDRFA